MKISQQPTNIIIDDICTQLQEVIRKSEKYSTFITIGIPGGRSITEVLKKMTEIELPWNKLRFFWIDERHVPYDHPDSNYGQAASIIFDQLITEGKLHKSQLILPEYSADLEQFRTNASRLVRSLGVIDILIAGSGEDGHMASLFPNHQLLQSHKNDILSITDSPKPPSARISVSPEAVRSAENCFCLFLGESKKEAYTNFLDTNKTLLDCPIKLCTESANCFVFTDIEL